MRRINDKLSSNRLADLGMALCSDKVLSCKPRGIQQKVHKEDGQKRCSSGLSIDAQLSGR
jgi:hypothetical protein